MKCTFKYFLTIIWILLALFCIAMLSASSEANLLDLKEVSIEYHNFAAINDKARDVLLYPESPKEGFNLGINFNVLWNLMYSESLIETMTTDSQYRSIGLQQRIGFNVLDMLRIGYYHHSQHMLDKAWTQLPTFPTEDALEVKLYLFRSK